MSEITFTDRYQALGIPYPDPATVCKGQCEGTGFYPVSRDDVAEREEWTAIHRRAHTLRSRVRIAWKNRDVKWLFHRCDGWHFVKCADCNGTGKRS